MVPGRCVRKGLLLAGMLVVMLSGQTATPFRVQVRAVDRNGDVLSKVRIAMLPVNPETTPLPTCSYPYCDRVSPGRYRLMVISENMRAVDREISVSQYDRVVFAEMIPAVFVEPNIAELQSVIAFPKVMEDQKSKYTVRMLGVLNENVRSEPVVNSFVEFPKVVTGRYLLLLLRNGRVVGCSLFWHDAGRVSREPLVPGEAGCELHM